MLEVANRVANTLEARDRSLAAASQAGSDVELGRALWRCAVKYNRLAKGLIDEEADGMLEISTVRPPRALGGLGKAERANEF